MFRLLGWTAVDYGLWDCSGSGWAAVRHYKLRSPSPDPQWLDTKHHLAMGVPHTGMVLLLVRLLHYAVAGCTFAP